MTLFRSEGANYDATADQGTLPADVRKGYEGLFTSTGVLPSSTSPLVEGAGDFTYTVHTGYWVTSRGGSDGFHYWGNRGDVSVATGVAPAAGLSRIDVIYALHPSVGENGDTTSVPVVAVAQGTEASSPVAPSIPVGALELARNTITSAATSTSSAGNTISQSAAKASVVGARTLGRMIRYRTTTASIADSTWVALGSWNEEVHTLDPEGDISGAGGTSYTVGFDGWARVRARVAFQGNANGSRYIRLKKNGTVIAQHEFARTGGSSTDSGIESIWDGPVVPGDVFTVEVYQTSGASLSTSVGAGATAFYIERTA